MWFRFQGEHDPALSKGRFCWKSIQPCSARGKVEGEDSGGHDHSLIAMIVFIEAWKLNDEVCQLKPVSMLLATPPSG
jgi:hypothetical protein